MAGLMGMDTDAVRQGAAILNAVAAAIAEGEVQVKAVLDTVLWAGPDADHARQEFAVTIDPSIKAVRQFLEDVAARMSLNAQQQDQASAA